MKEKENISIEQKCENLDSIENNINYIEGKLNNYNSIRFLSKRMLKVQPVLFAVMPLLCGLIFKDHLYGVAMGLTSGTAICGTATIFWGTTTLVSKKKIKEKNRELEQEKQLKQELEESLSNELSLKEELEQTEKVGLEEDLIVYEVSEKEFSELQKKRLEYLKKLAEENPEEARKIATKDLLNAGIVATDDELKSSPKVRKLTRKPNNNNNKQD
jgi:hypothetical protein